MKTPLTFAKIVATPSLSQWSQAYNAGNLAAVIALTKESSQTEEDITSHSLQALGKELLNSLEAEYFTLETKNLNSIKQAIMMTVEKADKDVTLSLGISVIIENVLYVFIYGKGTILMKRKDKLGVLLSQEEKENLVGASGFIEDGDIVILETPQFTEIVSKEILLPCLEHEKISEMAETLSPIIHEKQLGAAAALAFSYKEDGETKKELAEEEEQTETEEKTTQPEEATEEQKQPEQEKTETNFSPLPKVTMPHTRKLFLTIAVIIILVFGISVYFSIKHQQDTATKALFASTVIPAQKKYDEGTSLLDLNKNLAKTDFQDAKNLLDSVQGKFPSNSPEVKQYSDLVAKVNDGLTTTANSAIVDAKQVDNTSSPLLAALNSHPNSSYAAADDTTIFVADNKGITATTKATSKEKTVITNTTDWKAIGGFGVYLGNFYVLDKQAGIIKYANESAGNKSSYFSGSAPDLTNASDMTIDGSIWILANDGGITKYTRGKQDAFSVKGLDKPFSHPTRIVTSADMNNVYILDNGNKRIVVLDKTGNYTAQYQSGVLADASSLDVDEKNKKLFVLSGGKIYEIDMK